ncbi:MAG: VWA domain-containing protein [Alishewanella sp.]|nr:VWA domain-containing protein [Alishewanella sp.]
MFADFHFLRPYWLLALLPLALLCWLLQKRRQDTSPWQQLIAPHLQHVMLLGQHIQQRQPWALPLLASCWLLTVLALSGPSWQKLPQPALTVKKATVLVMDMSLSMRATDLTPDRLTQQRFKALDFIDLLQEGDLGLISYAADAFVISPLTPDHNNIRLQIPTLRPELMPAQGSNVLRALEQAAELLEQAGYPSGEIVLFTDGFDADSYQSIQQLLNNWPHQLAIMAFGQPEGAVVRLENGELLKNAQGGVVMPRVPLEQLRVLARQAGGSLVQAGADNADLQQLLKQNQQQYDDRQPQPLMTGDQWQDNAVYLVWLLLPLALWLARKAPILVILPLLYLPPADAVSWRDLWQTKQQQAVEDYQQQDYQQAQQKFRDPLWQGNAAYRAEDYAAAAEAYQRASNDAPSVDSWHNLGNALAMQQQYEAALAAYEQALALDPEAPSPAANAELMRKLLQQQEQEQQQQDQQQQDKQQGQQDGDAADDASSEKQNAEESAESEQNSAEDGSAGDSSAQAEQNAEQQEDAAQREQQAAQQATEQQPGDEPPSNKQQVVTENWPNATPEQQQELENLLRKVQDDPGILLRNRMLLEHQKRRTQPPPGARQEW